jgi:hypothetical protein
MPFEVEAYADETAMLLCTGCAELVALVVTFEDRRGGASLCEGCIAKAWEAMEAHRGPDGPGGGALTEVC